MSDNYEVHASEFMTDEQRVQSARLAAMRKILGSLMDSEEINKRGMRWDEIATIPGVGGPTAKKALEDLLMLKYVVCNTVSGVEETSGDVQISRLCELYATTFFGRKWFLEPIEPYH